MHDLRIEAAKILADAILSCSSRYDFPPSAFRVKSPHGTFDPEGSQGVAYLPNALSQNDEGHWTCFLFVTVEGPSTERIEIYLVPEIGFTPAKAELGWKGEQSRIKTAKEGYEAAIEQYANVLVTKVEEGIKLFTGQVYDHPRAEVGFHVTEGNG